MADKTTNFDWDSKDIFNALKDLDVGTRSKALGIMGRKAMKPVVEDAKAGTQKHSDTGALTESIAMRTRKGSRKQKDSVVRIIVGPLKKVNKEDSDGATRKTPTSQRNPAKAIAQEFGSKHFPKENPFLLPALEKNVQSVLQTIKQEYKDAIKKAKKPRKPRAKK